MKNRLYPILVCILCCFSGSFERRPARREHFLKIQPLSIADRHFAWGLAQI